jgi:hypothetical protein
MTELAVEQFSKHLFWDAKKSEIDFEKNKSYVIWQVLEYGKLEDWKLIKEHYGIQGIAKTAMTFRALEPKALNFISFLSGIPKEEFRCYTYQQLLPPHWYF